MLNPVFVICLDCLSLLFVYQLKDKEITVVLNAKKLRVVCSFVCLNLRDHRKDDAKKEYRCRQAVGNNNSDFRTFLLLRDFNR